MNSPLVLMDSPRINRSAKRMAYEILERNTDNSDIFLFGIDERGYAVAQKLVEVLSDIAEVEIDSAQLPLKKGDPYTVINELDSAEMQKNLVLIVDDVIFSGQTMFQALTTVVNGLELSEVHTAVMIDRGHRKFPVQAEFCGMELPTKVNEHVSVVVNGMDVLKVVLEKV
ncbi:phosphoribosyltransferase family protein [Fodinibius saliphilus]|uniref:phosphoribosyltransferase family protein n=1 Tax=Fodinibius saliphilus TaxID=1920650 RepID=UPI0011091E4D|nr:phosphoribosyltransferase family protein [Fodinibius saliphilus]